MATADHPRDAAPTADEPAAEAPERAAAAAEPGAADPASAAGEARSAAEVAEDARHRPRPARPQRGDELELTVDRLAHGGAGVARTEAGWVVFVGGAVPGDRVRAVVTKRKRGYGEARLLEVVEPSPERIAPVADHPGAPWQVLPYARQLEIKQEQVADALHRLGGLTEVELAPIVPAVEEWRYRNKLEYSFGRGSLDPSDAAAPDDDLVCGFHAPGSWETIVHVEDCLLATERGNAVRRAIHAWCREQGLEPYDRRTNGGFLRNLVVREGMRTDEMQARVVTSPGDMDVDHLALHLRETLGDARCSLLWTRLDGVGETTQGGTTEVVDGSEFLHEELRGLRFRISAEAFFQVNTPMAETLYGLAAKEADLRGFERLYDLFCGSGTVGLSLADRAGELWGVEIVEESIRDAEHNARLNDVRNATFLAADVRLGLPRILETAGRPDVLVVDPPRAGLSKKVVRRVVDAAPKRVVYVSCNPTTLAPNAAQLVEAGYVLRRVTPVDLFPQTPHVECVAVLDAGPDGVRNPDREA